jgi:hypothetical protein
MANKKHLHLAPSDSQVSFFDFPGEIRNMTYGYAIQEVSWDKRDDINAFLDRCRPFLQANAQIRREFLSFLIGSEIIEQQRSWDGEIRLELNANSIPMAINIMRYLPKRQWKYIYIKYDIETPQSKGLRREDCWERRQIKYLISIITTQRDGPYVVKHGEGRGWLGWMRDCGCRDHPRPVRIYEWPESPKRFHICWCGPSNREFLETDHIRASDPVIEAVLDSASLPHEYNLCNRC